MAKSNRGGKRVNSSKAQSKNNTPSILQVDTKFTQSQVKTMSRQQLEAAATAAFIKQNVKRGMDVATATYRAKSLMSGNTDAQLRKYIVKNG